MKTVKSVLIFALLSMSGLAYSQSGWYATTDSHAFLRSWSFSFPDQNTGYAGFFFPGYTSGVIFKTTNTGESWQSTLIDGYSVGKLWFIDANTGFYTGDLATSSVIFKTTNGGINWVNKLNTFIIRDIKFFDNNTGVFIAEYGRTYLTTDCGENWQITTGGGWSVVHSFYALTRITWLIANDGIYKTTNSGSSWRYIELYGTGMSAYSLFFINSYTGFNACTNGTVFKTLNGGENWSLISNLGFQFYNNANLFFTNATTGYIGSTENYTSLKKTTNGGYNWVPQTTYPFTNIYRIYFINQNTGFAGDLYGKIYKTTNGGIVLSENNPVNAVPDYELGQNYPNPFNQFSIIDFKLQMKSNVAIKVYDAAGREVQTLVDETLAPGTYRVRFDGSGLSSGLYYYCMTVGGKMKAVRKMVMMK